LALFEKIYYGDPIFIVISNTIPMFQFTTWHASFLDFFIKLRRNTVTGKQVLISNDRKSVR
ncbi:MAG: hypothetical protein ACK56F_02525, partial [bacterium]